MFDILVYGLSVAVCGMATVFLALIILIGLVKGLEKFTNGEIASLVKSKLADKLGAVAPQQPAKSSSIPTLDDAELFAVITAAVAAVMEEEAKVVAAAAPTAEAAAQVKPASFVVRSIRRVNNAPAWNRAGREEQVYSRM